MPPKSSHPLKFYISRSLDLSFDDFSDYRLVHALTTIKTVNGKITLSNGDQYNRAAFDREFISIDELTRKHFKKGKLRHEK